MHISILSSAAAPTQAKLMRGVTGFCVPEELGVAGLFQTHDCSYPSLGMGCLGSSTRTWEGITSALVPQIFTPA